MEEEGPAPSDAELIMRVFSRARSGNGGGGDDTRTAKYARVH
jgi:hypothetical protein